MRIGIDYGLEHIELDVPEANVVPVFGPQIGSGVEDVAGAVEQALEEPLNYPALRRALAPDDHIAIVIDESLPQLAQLLTPILAHLVQAKIDPEAITLVCAPSASNQPWLEDLPDEYQEVKLETHDPADRRKHSYLATTKQGRRIYLNRTAVDADQLVVLTRRSYDPLLGYAGGVGSIYPSLADEATWKDVMGSLSLAAPQELAWPVRQEAEEVAWLLGAPFLVQLIEGVEDEIVHIIGGSLDSCAEGRSRLDARWRHWVDRPAQNVVASLCGDPGRHDFQAMAHALGNAARVAEPGGRIILLTASNPGLAPGAELVRHADSPKRALDLLRQQAPHDVVAAFEWASVVSGYQVYVCSGMDEETAEELFTTPLERAGQAQRLLSGDETCLVLRDAHKGLVEVRNG